MEDEQLRLPLDGAPLTSDQLSKDLFPERERAIDEFMRRYGLPVGAMVRVTLKGIPGEFTGKLTLDTLLFPEKAKEAIPMRIGRVQFDMRDIESCSRL